MTESKTESDQIGNNAKQDLRGALRRWILAAGNRLTEETLTDTTPLFADHHLSSLHLPELILTLERLRGRRIDLARLKAPDLRDVQTLCARFLGDADGEAAATAAASAAGGGR
jgi:hypothetical protein